MGFFTGLGKAARIANEQARLNGALYNGVQDLNRLKKLGASRVDGDVLYAKAADQAERQLNKNGFIGAFQAETDLNNTVEKMGRVLLDEGKGYARQILEKEYGLNSDEGNRALNIARQYRDDRNQARGEVDYWKFTPGYKRELDKIIHKGRGGNTAKPSPSQQYDTDANNRDLKAQNNMLVQREIEAVKNMAGIDNTLEAIGVANTNRLQNDNYLNVLYENSNYAREQLNQGNMNVADRFVELRDALNNGQIDPQNLATADLGVIRGGLKYQDNPQQPIRMAGDELNRFIGSGSFADVFRDPNLPGVVQKVQPEVVEVGGQLFPNQARQEVEYQLAAAERGIGPRVDYLELNPDGSTVIGMQNIRDNYRSFDEAEKELSPEQIAGALIKHNLQLGELNKDGIRMADRHKGNVQLNNMNNRPLQIDFGPATNAPGGSIGFQGTMAINNDNGNQAYEIGQRAAKAMIAAGLEDEGKILNDTIISQIKQGNLEGALDVANQGLAVASNLRGRVKTNNVLSPAAFEEMDGTLSAATSDNLLGNENLYSRFN